MTSLIKFNGNDKRLGFPAFPSLFDDFLIKKLFNPEAGNGEERLPLENIKETKSTYEFEISVPGMKKSDFKIEFENDRLIISSERQSVAEETKKDDHYYKKEITYNAFKRVIDLPENSVNEDEIKASYLDGILYISLPKKAVENKLLKEIPID